MLKRNQIRTLNIRMRTRPTSDVVPEKLSLQKSLQKKERREIREKFSTKVIPSSTSMSREQRKQKTISICILFCLFHYLFSVNSKCIPSKISSSAEMLSVSKVPSILRENLISQYQNEYGVLTHTEKTQFQNVIFKNLNRKKPNFCCNVIQREEKKTYRKPS